jgi:hypothetical protein
MRCDVEVESDTDFKGRLRIENWQSGSRRIFDNKSGIFKLARAFIAELLDPKSMDITFVADHADEKPLKRFNRHDWLPVDVVTGTTQFVIPL